MKYTKSLSIFVITIILLLTLIVPINADMFTGLKNYWSFDETSGTNVVNLINGSMNGTTYNGHVVTTGSWVKGRVRNALQLWNVTTPVQYFNTTYQNLTNITKQNFSINFWANLSGNTPTRILMSDRAGTSYITFTGDGTGLQWHIDGTTITGTIANAKNKWQMYTILYNSTDNNVSIWQNGTILTSAIAGAAAYNDLPVNYIGTYNAMSAPLNGSLDEFGIWNRTLTFSEISSLYSGYSYPFTINLLSPSNGEKLLIQSNNSFSCAGNYIGYNVTNISFYNNATGAWHKNYTEFNPLNTTSFNATFGLNITNPKIINWTCDACFGDGTCSKSPDNYVNLTNLVDNGIAYNPLSSVGSTETFTWNISLSSNDTFTGASLNYAGNTYSASINSFGNNNYVVSRTINVPSTPSTYNFNFTFTTTSGTYTSTTNNQYVGSTVMDNCTTYTRSFLNFTMVDEETLLAMNGTIELLANLYIPDTTVLASTLNISLNYTTGYKSGLCLNNMSNAYDLAYTIRHYGNISYFKKYRTMQLQRITNTTVPQNLTLYNLLTTRGYAFTVTILGASVDTRDLLVEAQKQYLSLNRFLTVESAVTDSNSQVVLNLIPTSETYNFIVSYRGQVLGTFPNQKGSCQNPSTGQCTFTLNLGAATTKLPDYMNYLGLSIYQYYSAQEKTLYFTFSSIDGNAHNVTQKVVKFDGYGNTTICFQSQIISSNTYPCPIPTTYQNTTIISMISVDGSPYGQFYFTLGSNPEWFGADIYIELLMFSSLVMMMLSSPFLIVLGAIIGILVSITLLLITGGTWGAVIGSIIFYIAAGVIIIWQIGRKM